MRKRVGGMYISEGGIDDNRQRYKRIIFIIIILIMILLILLLILIVIITVLKWIREIDYCCQEETQLAAIQRETLQSISQHSITEHNSILSNPIVFVCSINSLYTFVIRQNVLLFQFQDSPIYPLIVGQGKEFFCLIRVEVEEEDHWLVDRSRDRQID